MGSPTLSKFNSDKVAPFKVTNEKTVLFDIWNFILFVMVGSLGYLTKSSLIGKLLNTQEGSLTVNLLACAALYGLTESHFGPPLSNHNMLAP